jgi:hypothetical protein
VLVINSTALKAEVMYVMGGKVTCTDQICYDGQQQAHARKHCGGDS